MLSVIKLLPVICPVLLVNARNACFVLNSLGVQPLVKKRSGFCSLFLLLDIYMYKRMSTVPLQQLLLDKVNMGNVPNLLLYVAVILNINTHIRRHGANGSSSFGIFGANFYGKLVPGFHWLISLKGVFYFVKKALALLIVPIAGGAFKLPYHILLLRSKVGGNLHIHANVFVAAPLAIHIGNALVAKAESRTGLCALRHGVRNLAVHGGHDNVVAEHRLSVGNGNIHPHVKIVAAEDGIFRNGYGYVQISGRTAVCTVIALTANHKCLAVVNTRRDID